MNIDILDPGLCFVAGHHLEWDLRLVRELAMRGHRIRVFAHKQIEGNTAVPLERYAKVVPHFRVSPYLNPALFEQHSDIGMRVFDPLAGQLVHFLDGAKNLAQDIASIEAGGLTIWPSLVANQLYAQALAPQKTVNLACIQIDSSFAASAGAMFWRYAWLKARDVGLDFRLGVTVSELQSEYSSVFPEERIHIWPVCVNSRIPAEPRRKITRIGFFGEQRGEKGAGLLQQTVPQLLSKGWQVVVHDSGHRIRGESTGNFIRLGYVEDIVSEIEKCDVIVVPYDPAAYRSRGSSIVWEALACGVPVVVPQNSAPGRFALSLGAGIGLQAINSNEILSAVFAADANYKVISESAFMASKNWAANHGAGRYADALLAAA